MNIFVFKMKRSLSITVQKLCVDMGDHLQHLHLEESHRSGHAKNFYWRHILQLRVNWIGDDEHCCKGERVRW